MAAKKHYFGVGGGSRRFLSLVEKDGKLSFISNDVLSWSYFSFPVLSLLILYF